MGRFVLTHRMGLGAAVVVACFSAATAAEPKAGQTGAWSAPVEGVRVRLVSEKGDYKAGEALALRLELQNVTERRLLIHEPQLMPLICPPGDHPYGEGHGFPWIISTEPVGRKIHIHWAKQQVQHAASALRVLAPGATHTVLIRGVARERKDVATRMRREGEPQRETVRFVFGRMPGKYDLRATFRAAAGHQPARGDTFWRARSIATPPITIRIVR